MLKQHARFVDLGLRLFDLLVLTAALPLAHALYLATGLARAEPPPVERLWLPMVAVMILWIATSGSTQVYGAYRTQSMWAEIGRIARAVVTMAVLFTAAMFLLKDLDAPRLLVTLFFAVALVLLAFTRITLRSAAHMLRRRGFNTRNYAVVGVGAAAESVARTFEKHPQWGFQLAGFILPDDRPAPSPQARVLGTLANLENILDENVLDKIVFAVSRDRLAEIEPAVKLCEEQGVAVVVSLEPFHIATGRMSLFELSDLSMLVFTRTPSDAAALALKRAFDVMVSATALLLLAPLFLVVAAAIKLESPGPVFFRHRRVGLNGRPFQMLKFRSMCDGAEKRLEALRALNEMNGPTFKMKADPRVTRVGRILRRTSIDELPQFWNVLKGEMSVVGPRPPIPAEVRQYKRWQRRRLSVKPGITCTWQVSGRSDIDFDRWMELDLEYIDNWSLWRDLSIFLRTIPAVITARGAH